MEKDLKELQIFILYQPKKIFNVLASGEYFFKVNLCKEDGRIISETEEFISLLHGNLLFIELFITKSAKGSRVAKEKKYPENVLPKQGRTEKILGIHSNKPLKMKCEAVIFDMDGLLIDSEPLWREAGKETLASFGKVLTNKQYQTSTGLRTEEWIEHWFTHFQISSNHAPEAVSLIIRKAIENIRQYGEPMPGVYKVLDFFHQRKVKVGLATSSPLSLVGVVLKKLGLENSFHAVASAENLPYGKPHPLVYLKCADTLQVPAVACIAFEDSFNGLIAAKAARMKCVVVPSQEEYHALKWNAADMKLKSLEYFNEKDLFTL